MSNLGKNAIALFVGTLLTLTFVWLVGFGAATPVPEVLQKYTHFAVYHYSDFVTALSSLGLSFLMIAVAKKAFKLTSWQQVVWCIMPMVGYYLYFNILTHFTMPHAISYAIAPALIMSVFLLGQKNKP